MTVPFLRAYSQLLIRPATPRRLRHGRHGRADPDQGRRGGQRGGAQKVREDKEREAGDGHDGTWVAHPGLIPIAMEIFDASWRTAQPARSPARGRLGQRDRPGQPCEGTITEAGVRGNINVAIRYMAAWLAGQGCVPINHLMEDAATAEIARAQVWQWARHDRGVLEDGRDIDLELIARWQAEELAGFVPMSVRRVRRPLPGRGRPAGRSDRQRRIHRISHPAGLRAAGLKSPPEQCNEQGRQAALSRWKQTGWKIRAGKAWSGPMMPPRWCACAAASPSNTPWPDGRRETLALLNEEDFVNALGALTGNQAMQQVKAGLKAIYLSGWQVAADANLAGQMYPDQSLYPADSVPNRWCAHQQHACAPTRSELGRQGR
jgi:malate synthase